MTRTALTTAQIAMASLLSVALLAACQTGERDDPRADDNNTSAMMTTPEETTPPPEDESLPYLEDDSARQWLNMASWYPQDYLELDRAINALLDEHGATPKRRALGIIAPHAGIKHSGAVAAAAYGSVEIPDTVILLAPKHHNKGASPSIWREGPILLPGHAITPHAELSMELAAALGEEELTADRASFEDPNTHPYELQLPFLTTANPDVELVSVVFFDISVAHFKEFDQARIETWGKALAEIVQRRREAGEEVLIVASTDLVHRVPAATQQEQDTILLDHIEALDVDGLYKSITEDNLTMCGEIPVAILMQTAIELGHERADIVARGSSLDTIPNEESVVGYGGVVIWEDEQ